MAQDINIGVSLCALDEGSGWRVVVPDQDVQLFNEKLGFLRFRC